RARDKVDTESQFQYSHISSRGVSEPILESGRMGFSDRVSLRLAQATGQHRFRPNSSTNLKAVHFRDLLLVNRYGIRFSRNLTDCPTMSDAFPKSDSDAPASPPPAEPELQRLRSIASETLLQGQQEILITHGAELYRLRLTRNGKLILQK